QAFPAARITLQDYSQPMIDCARQRLAGRSGHLSYVLGDLLDPSWPEQVGGPFDLAVSAIALHNLRDPAKIFACYRALPDLLQRAIHEPLRPGGYVENFYRSAEG